MKEAEVFSEIEDVIRGSLDQGQSPVARWICHAVISAHPCEEFDGSDFFELAASKYIRSMVRKVLKKYQADESAENNQFVLAGFSRLQEAYTIDRDGEQTIVLLRDMTPDEVAAKAAELRKMARGNEAHADELDRHLAERMSA